MNAFEKKILEAIKSLDASRIHDIRLRRDGPYSKVEIWIGSESTDNGESK